MSTKPTKPKPEAPLTTFDYRRENLRSLIKVHDGPTGLAKVLGYANPSFIVQMAGPSPSRDVTESTARNFEAKLGLESGFLDRKPNASAATIAIDAELLNNAIRVVTQECDNVKLKFAPAKFADLVTMVYTEALANGGKIKMDQLKMIIQFAVK
jgi:hypothetical protein